MTAKHVHKLKRLKYKSGNTIFFCSLPDCTYKTNTALALGKRSICWRCGKDFIMTEYCLRLAKPHCESCHKSKNIEAKIDEIIIQPQQLVEKSLLEKFNEALHKTQPEGFDEEI